MRKFLFVLLFIPQLLMSQNFIRKDTTISHGSGTWNVSFYMDSRYYGQTGTDSTQMIIFFPGRGESGDGFPGLKKFGPLDYLDAGWDGGVPLGNGTHYPILVAVEQIGAFPCNVVPRISAVIQQLTSRFRVKSKNGRKCVHLTGLSAGGYTAKIAVMSDPYSTTGPWPNASQVMSVVDVQGVAPNCQDATNDYAKWIENFARSGGRLVSFEGSTDFRDHQTVINRMNATVANSGIYYRLTAAEGMAAHCCWQRLYGGNGSATTGGTPPMALTFDGKKQTLYQWMLRQGDTTLTNSVIQVAVWPDRTITYPETSVIMNGSVDLEDNSIVSYDWKQKSGSTEAIISSPTSATTNISGLEPGEYTFSLTVTDNLGAKASEEVVITAMEISSTALNAPPVIQGTSDYGTTTGSVSLNFTGSDDSGAIARWSISKLKSPGQTRKTIVVIGSSTAYGYGVAKDSSWVRRVQRFYKNAGVIDTIINFSKLSKNIFNGAPTGYKVPARYGSSSTYTPDTTGNLTRALRVPGVKMVIVSYPTNGFDTISVADAMAVMRAMRDTAKAHGVEIFFTSAQPREDINNWQKKKLRMFKDSLGVQFPNNYANFYHGFYNEQPTTVDGTLTDTAWLSRRYDWRLLLDDKIHFNEAGHGQFAKQFIAANPFKLFTSDSNRVANPFLSTTGITNLTQGTHLYIVAAQDNDSLWSYSTVSITSNTNDCGSLNAPVLNVIGTKTLCIDDSIVLNVTNPCTGCRYIWSDGVSGERRVVNTPGAYSLKTIDSCGMSPVSSVVTIAKQNIWLGIVDDAWDNPLNWSCGIVPTNQSDVLISGGTPFNCIIKTPATCRKLTLINKAILVNKSELSVFKMYEL